MPIPQTMPDRTPRTKTQVVLGGAVALLLVGHFIAIDKHPGIESHDAFVFVLIVVALGYAGGYGITAPLDSATRFVQAMRGSTKEERANGVTGDHPVTPER